MVNKLGVKGGESSYFSSVSDSALHRHLKSQLGVTRHSSLTAEF